MSSQTAEAPPPDHSPPADPPPYDRDAIFQANSPIDPRCVAEAVTAIKRATPLDPSEPREVTSRRLHGMLRNLSALHARDEIELMLGVQALSAYYAACACWRLGMNLTRPHGESTRHIATAASAARAFDTMLRALERRQAKPLSVPIGRPAPRPWPEAGSERIDADWKHLLSPAPGDFIRPGPGTTPSDSVHTTDDEVLDATYGDIEDEDDLDLDSIEGILPNGGMIVPKDPTPGQRDYMEVRLRKMYRREREENHRNGIFTKTVFRPTRTGDLIP